ncbi:MAG: hypothetical protein QOF43_885 [Gaiellaceae bacterium]|nr:hypothetical protein [Gaiellaceae bacterium]
MAAARRSPLLIAVLTVVLWVAGLAISGANDNLADKASDEQTLSWVQGNANTILLSAWVFALGCLAFIWFAGLLRSHLAEREGGQPTLSTIMFGAAVAAAVFAMATTGDVASAINKDNVTPATAGALHHLGDLFFVVAELALILVLLPFALLVLRTAAFPRWWAYVSLLIAVVLLIGPIGWAALIFGTPIWVLVTGWMMTRKTAAVATG